MNEIWKTIIDYEDYEISNLGQVRNKKTLRILKPCEDKDGYFMVGLYNDGKRKPFSIHRLVACAFLENPNMLQQVNHKDENKKNNCVDNLEFCSPHYNTNYGSRNKKLSKPVVCVETGEIFASARDVQRKKGYNNANISHVCKGKLKTAYGYQWQYV